MTRRTSDPALKGRSYTTGLNPRAVKVQAPAYAGEESGLSDARAGGDLLF